MTKLTFYGGIREIGGNKILLEDEGENLLLDFGFPYKRHKLFYEEYLKPRSGAGILDPLSMGMIPPLEGIYRKDIASPEIWCQFRHHPFYRKLDNIDGVLLSHAHFDHSAHIAFLHEDIPIFSTALTAFIAKSTQDSGRSDFDQQVCYYSPAAEKYPTGCKQVAFISSGEAKCQRQFYLGDMDVRSLSDQANNFWSWSLGFSEKKGRQKEIASRPLRNLDALNLELKCFSVDHSIPGACAWGINTNSGWVIYSGDLRLHGKRTLSTRRFIEQTASLQPRVLIIEGTNINRDKNISEQEVYENAMHAITKAQNLVIADFSAKDIDRLLTFLQIARDTDRKLAILPKDAYLLKTMRLLDKEIPDIAQDKNIVIYHDTVARADTWVQNIFQEYADKVVLAEDLGKSQEEFILCFSFFDLNEFPSMHPQKNSLYVFSSSEPHDEEQQIDFRRLHNWLEHFGFVSYGLPEEKDGEWQIPENERGLHASGHACGADLISIVKNINPDFLIPVHSEAPELYIKYLEDTKIKVLLPEMGESIIIQH